MMSAPQTHTKVEMGTIIYENVLSREVTDQSEITQSIEQQTSIIATNANEDTRMVRRNRDRSRRCLDNECQFDDYDATIPNHVIAEVLDNFSDKDMDHIKEFHPKC